MLKKILLLLLTLCLSDETYAQITNIDSLEAVLGNEKQDTTRILLMNDLAYSYVMTKPEKSEALAFEALELSRRIGYLKGEAKSLNMIANEYRRKGNTLKAMEILLQALKINEKNNYSDGLSNNLGVIGSMLDGMGDYRQALRYHFKSKAIREKLNWKQEICIADYTIGTVYKNLNILDSARIFTQQAYDLARQINYDRIIGNSLVQMGDINFLSGQYTVALEYYRLSIPSMIKAGNGLSWSSLAMATVFKKTGQLDSALNYANQALAIRQKRGEIIAPSLGTLLYTIHKSKGNVDSALFYLEMAKAATDSGLTQEKRQQLQNLIFDEQLRQQELASAEFKAKEERKHDLQYAAIAIGLICFIILFFALSRSIIVKTKFIEFFGILGLLAVFEFINLLIHPYLEQATNHIPVLMLIVLITIGALLIPVHHRLEKWMTHIMVEKNKKIRLEAARKTINQLEGAN
jgi:tetratricopeptide (TPR) repeat protein